MRWVPMFVIRRLVRKNPWLLSDHGVVRDTKTLILGPLEIEMSTETELSPEIKAQLQAERDRETD